MGCGAAHRLQPVSQDVIVQSVKHSHVGSWRTTPKVQEELTEAGYTKAVELPKHRSDTGQLSLRGKEEPAVARGGLRILQLDDFDLLDLLDETPMSAVFRLRHRRTGLTLAGKRIRKGCEVHQSGDYLNEVKMLQLCKSPYIVTLHGVCDSGTDFWTVLELCSGGRMEPWLRRFPNTARTVVLQLIEAVKYLHSKLVCHLDLKPDNVLLSGTGDIRLCDFVTSVQLSDAQQQMMGKCGTPQFRAPEVECGGAYNGLKADVFSLGRTLQVAQETPTKQAWPELVELIPHMLQLEPLQRPGVMEIHSFLTGGSQSVLKIDWSALGSVRCDEAQPRKAPVRMGPRGGRNATQQSSAPSKACGSNYCQRLGACICHDRVPTCATIMSPQERRAQLRRCNTP
ncbi:unnamed protein product [Cladocopium goreaui]|uniref:Sperm motility kinase 2B n=1 Tax=Cladocopium goreaui TaxID=2562237 RepID=A0A9P1DGC0_9DINO|nr:unnamed protein product [Cladocopium goreaui]